MEHLVIAITAKHIITESKDGEVVTFDVTNPVVQGVQVGDTINTEEQKPAEKAQATSVKKKDAKKGASGAKGCSGMHSHLRNPNV